MLQTQKKQKFNINKLIFKTLTAIFAVGAFGIESLAKDIVSTKDKTLLLKPIDNLSNEQYDEFMLGRSFFTIPWVEAPSATTARDGLGPLFNANSCASCHTGNGRGTLFNKTGNFARALIPKLSNDPIYGNQISINSIHGVKFEAKADIKYEKIRIKFPDGEIDTLLKPIYKLKDMQYGPLHKNTILTFRLAPSLNGLGLLEDIKNEDILKNADEFDKDKDGVSGRANYVYSPITKKTELGKYSWKANISTLKHQIVDAANNDMGLVTSYYPNENCTNNQKECLKAPKSRDKFDLTEQRIEAITFYLKNRKTYSAKKDNSFKEGLEVFKAIGCVKCHVDSFTTASGKEITPFTDMLLHDMGEGLADGIKNFKATGNEFRTPALWGLSLHEKINNKKPRLLHDGRARDFQEAILWHGGEAKQIKENYINLNKEQRDILIKFLEEI